MLLHVGGVLHSFDSTFNIKNSNSLRIKELQPFRLLDPYSFDVHQAFKRVKGQSSEVSISLV